MMKITLVLFLSLFQAVVITTHQLQLLKSFVCGMQQNSSSATDVNSSSSSNWRAANYRGLVIGKSTKIDMLNVLGEPKYSSTLDIQLNDNKEEELNEYEVEGKLSGKLSIYIDTQSQVILAIDLYPKNLSESNAVKRFGGNYVITRYDFDTCLSKDDGESAPMYESANGELKYIEYRKSGIAIALDEHGNVKHISYVKNPIGAAVSKCKQSGNVI